MLWDERSRQIQQTNNNIISKMEMPVETEVGELVNTPEFICKLYAMIKEHPQTISFSEDGNEVHIHDKEKFTRQILKNTFRHDKWRSFIRQMNMYNFRKVNRGMQTYIFVNNIFREGNQANFYKIKRKINSKEQQMSTQNSLQQDLKILLKLQSHSLGIANNTALLQYDLNQNQEVHLIPSHLKLENDKYFHLNGVNEGQRNLNTLNTIPSLTTLQTKILANKNYTNSLIYFLQKSIKYRKQADQLCGEVKQCMEYITKERKTVENKNILNTVKDSTQMIDQMANKFKQKIGNYVDCKVTELQQNLQHFSNYTSNNADEKRELNNVPVTNGFLNIDLLEYISGHSFQNIPDPISNRFYSHPVSSPVKILQSNEVKLEDEEKKETNIKITKFQNRLNDKTLNMRFGANQSFPISSINPIIPQPIPIPIPITNSRREMNQSRKVLNFENNLSISNNENILGLTSQCSFSSLNLEKQ